MIHRHFVRGHQEPSPSSKSRIIGTQDSRFIEDPETHARAVVVGRPFRALSPAAAGSLGFKQMLSDLLPFGETGA
jgi:hypothetical protein